MKPKLVIWKNKPWQFSETDGKHERIVKMCKRPKFTVHLTGVPEGE